MYLNSPKPMPMLLYISYDSYDHNKMTVHIRNVDLDKFKQKQDSSVWRDSASYQSHHSDDFDDQDEDLEETPVFRKRLLKIEGIEAVITYRHSISFQKAELYFWKDLIPVIKRILDSELNQRKPSEFVSSSSCKVRKKSKAQKEKKPKVSTVIKDK